MIKEIVLLQILQESLPVAAPLHPHLFKGNMVITSLFHDDLYFSQMKRRVTIQIWDDQLFVGEIVTQQKSESKQWESGQRSSEKYFYQ